MSGLGMYFDLLFFPFMVVAEDNLMSTAGCDLSNIILAIRIGFRGFILTVPESPDNVGMVDISSIKGHKHLD